jgi:DHA1 family multidrug resistance protein-like MFS transporter
VGIIFSGFLLARLILMPFVGRLSDKKGRKSFIMAGLFFYALLSLGYVWADRVGELAFVRMLHGLAAALVLPIAIAYIGDITPQGREGVSMGSFNIALFLGFGFGPLMGGILKDYLSMNSAFLAMGGLAFVALVLVLKFLPNISVRERRFKGKEVSFRLMFESKVLKGLLIFRLVNALGRGSIICFLPLFAANTLKLSGSQIGVVISILVLSIALLQTPFGILADRFNRRNMVVLGSIIGSLCLLWIPVTRSFLELILVGSLMGASGAIAIPAAAALMVGEGSSYGMGSTMALFNMAMDLGQLLGMIVGGLIFDYLGLSYIFYFGCVMGFIGTGIFIHYLRDYIGLPDGIS